MTATAERIVREIRNLPPQELQAVWTQLSQLVSEKSGAPDRPPSEVSEAAFQAALEEVTGCSAGSHLSERLLAERKRERERERQELATHQAMKQHG